MHNTHFEIQHYLDIREELEIIFLLVDCRHAPSEDDLMMLEWIRYFEKPYAVIATKADKVKPSQRQGAIEVICEDLQISADELIVFSAETGEGKEKILEIPQYYYFPFYVPKLFYCHSQSQPVKLAHLGILIKNSCSDGH